MERATSSRRAIFLDRDGILNELRPDPLTGEPEGPLQVNEVALVSDAADSVRQLREAGYFLVGITNQPAAAKGRITLAEQDAIHQQVLELLQSAGAPLDHWRICPHHPLGTIPFLTTTCDCRKPSPGMILDAARKFDIELSSSWMVGDSDSDVAAGKAAGTKTVLVGNRNNYKRQHPELADIRAFSLTEAVKAIFIDS
jgi:histidinol-phosphate phosphatase family protein